MTTTLDKQDVTGINRRLDALENYTIGLIADVAGVKQDIKEIKQRLDTVENLLRQILKKL